jgi:hypothetical protein
LRAQFKSSRSKSATITISTFFARFSRNAVARKRKVAWREISKYRLSAAQYARAIGRLIGVDATGQRNNGGNVSFASPPGFNMWCALQCGHCFPFDKPDRPAKPSIVSHRFLDPTDSHVFFSVFRKYFHLLSDI